MNRIQIVERNKASLGLRFVNRIVDLICFYVLLIIILYLFSFIARVTESDLLIGFLMNFFQRRITFYLTIYSVELLFYYISELLLKGRTVGKYITGTKVVTIFGEIPNSSQVLKRTLSRLIPFDALSFFGENGWHDSWSDTRVVKISDFENAMRMENELENIGKE